jgi:hypothetical protein
MFEGVSRDDVNYHMLVYCSSESLKKGEAASANAIEGDEVAESGSQTKETNQLLLIYPNGIISIYEDVL